MRAICPGSFDPVTHGHLDIIARAARLADEVWVGVGANAGKSALFTPPQRVQMLTEALTGLPRPERAAITVTTFDGLLVDFCREHDIEVVVKGLRFAADFDYELQMAQMNDRLGGPETVLLPTSAQWGHVSSSLVRDIARFGGDVSPFVPDVVVRHVRQRGFGAAAGGR